MADLSAFGERVQIGGGCSVTSGSSGLLRGFTGRSLCCTVGLQRCSPLQTVPLPGPPAAPLDGRRILTTTATPGGL